MWRVFRQSTKLALRYRSMFKNFGCLDTGTMSQTEVKSGTREVALLKETIIKASGLKVLYGRWGKVITRLRGKERMAALLQRRKNNMPILSIDLKVFFSLIWTIDPKFPITYSKQKQDQTDVLLKLLKENFIADDDLVLLAPTFEKKWKLTEKAKALFGSKPQSSALRSFDLEEALLARDLGEVNKGEKVFLSLARGGFRPGLCYQQIAKDYFEQKKFEKAKEFYQKALIYLSDDPKSWSNLASVYKRLGNRTQEIKALQKSFSLNPQSRSIFQILFRALTQFGAWKRAYDLCIRSKEINIPKECLLDF